jgi:hypothetical protein
MVTTINTIRKTSREWEEADPVIPYDILGIEEQESGKYKIKRGDGVTAWSSLGYFIGAGLSREECDDIVDDYTTEQRSPVPVPNKTAMYNGHKGLKSDKPPTEDNDVVRLAEFQSADTAFQQALSDEEAARESADAALREAIDDETTARESADGDIQQALSDEEAARESADAALQEAIDDEAAAREDADAAFREADTALENDVADLNAKMSALNGAYFVLGPYDFGKPLDVLDADDVLILNTYAISQTPGASSTGDLNDNTVVINEFDNGEFIYNKHLDAWLFYPNGLLTISTNQSLGVVKGVSDPHDGSEDGRVTVNLHGEMEALGFTGLKGRVAAAEQAVAGKLDAEQSPEDAGKAMVIGSGGALEPGFSGVVDSVDGVGPADPETSKNVELTVEMTRAEHDALEDPPGSGLYPSLAGKTVTLKDVYPDNGAYMTAPDGASMDNQNLWPRFIISTINDGHSLLGQWPADRTGYYFIGAYVRSTPDNANIYMTISVNGCPMYMDGMEVSGSPWRFYKRTIQAAKGDVISVNLSSDGGTPEWLSQQCNYTPPKFVKV